MGGLAFTALYLLHRVLQGTGPESSTAAAVSDYNLAHRESLLASEVAVGLALLAFIPFLAALVPVIWRAGQEPLAVAVAVSGGVFVSLAFVSNAAETALIGRAAPPRRQRPGDRRRRRLAAPGPGAPLRHVGCHLARSPGRPARAVGMVTVTDFDERREVRADPASMAS
jgi:hypothetical protein